MDALSALGISGLTTNGDAALVTTWVSAAPVDRSGGVCFVETDEGIIRLHTFGIHRPDTEGHGSMVNDDRRLVIAQHPREAYQRVPSSSARLSGRLLPARKRLLLQRDPQDVGQLASPAREARRKIP